MLSILLWSSKIWNFNYVPETVQISSISILGDRDNIRPVCDHIEMEKSVKMFVDMEIAEWNEIKHYPMIGNEITNYTTCSEKFLPRRTERWTFLPKIFAPRKQFNLKYDYTLKKPSKFCVCKNSWICKLYTPWPRWPPGSGRYCSSDLILSRGPRPPTYISSMPSE